MIAANGSEAKSALVAVIAGNEAHRSAVATALTSFYRVAGYADYHKAVADLIKSPPCVILVDEMVPPYGGFTVIKRLREEKRLAGVPIVCTVDTNSFSGDPRHIGADHILPKPFRRSALVRTLSGLVSKAVEARWDSLPEIPREGLKKTVELFNGISDLIDNGEPLVYETVQQACAPLITAVQSNEFKSILANVKGHDNYSYVHSLRVGTLLSLFGYTMGLRGDDLSLLASGGLVHDIGKMFIPYEVLNKPGKLEDKEWLTMKSHVSLTSEHLKKSADMPRGVLIIAEQHHEKLDGTGYPNGISNLNQLARMAAIADVFSALTERRCYKPPLSPEKALAIMTGEMAAGLDQNLLELFREMLLDSAL